jgi:hypothetical protein
MTANFFQKYIADDTSVTWYDEYTLLKNTKIGEALSPVSDLILDFDTVELRKFFAGSVVLTEPGGRGFAIKEVETEHSWSPVFPDDVIKIGDLIIIESTLGTLIPDDVFIVAAPSNVVFEPSLIKFPSLKDQEVYARTSASHLVNLVEPKYEWVETSFGDFGKPHVAFVEVINNEISEKQIRDAGKTKRKPDELLTEENFKLAHKLYVDTTQFSQTVPYFKKTITCHSLDLPNLPKIGEGLLDLKISMSSEGMNVNISFGTELFAIRPAGFYMQVTTNKKRKEKMINSSSLLNGRRGPRR